MGKIDELGKRLRLAGETPSQADLDMLQEYRRSFSEALPAVFEALRYEAQKIDDRSIVTFRIKRIDTIIRKLQRSDNFADGPMSLRQMGDIAGCRCILNSLDTKKIYKVAAKLQQRTDLEQKGKVRDYVEGREDGYKSLHLYLRPKEGSKQVEVQIRNKEMHNWATLVEIIDLIYGEGIKEGNKKSILQDFLLFYSRKNQLAPVEADGLIAIEKQMEVFDRMCKMFSHNYTQVRQQWANRNIGANYLVIEAGKNFKTTLSAFKSFEEAEADYYEKYLQNRKTNVVMIYSAKSDFRELSFAYSNYILSLHSFFFDYKDIIEKRIIEAAREGNTYKIISLQRKYRKIVLKYFECVRDERIEFEKSLDPGPYQQIYKIEWQKDLEAEERKWRGSVDQFTKNLSRAVYGMNNWSFHSKWFRLYFNRLNNGIHKVLSQR